MSDPLKRCEMCGARKTPDVEMFEDDGLFCCLEPRACSDREAERLLSEPLSYVLGADMDDGVAE